MRLAILASAAVFCAGAAFGEDLPCTTSDENGQRATKEFVGNYNAAQRAFEVKDWADVIVGAALARPHAIYGQQLSALLQIEVAAYYGRGSQASLTSMLEGGIEAPCMSEVVRDNHRRMLATIRSKPAAPQQQ